MSSLAPLPLSSAITNTRTTAGYYWNSSGVLTSADVGVSRIDYDPGTLSASGLLLEETRTNLLLNSAALSTQNITTSAQAYTLSFYGTGSITKSGTSTGTLAGTGATTRVSSTFTPTAGTLTLTVSGSVLYAQLEAGAYLTSYISTAGTSVQRTRDASTIASLSDWFSETAGTVYAEILMPFTPPADGVLRRVFQIDDGTENNRIALYLSTATLTANMVASSSTQVSASLGTVTANTAKKVAYAWSANDCAAIAAGNSIQTDSSATLPTVTTARLGCATATGSDLSGYIRAFRYYPRRLTNTELTALVA